MNSFEWVLYYSMAYLNSIICNIFWFTPFSSVSTDTNSSTQTACTSPGFDMLQQELIFFQCHFGYFISFIFVYMQWFLLDIKSHFNFVVQAWVSVWWTTLWASCCLILSLLPKRRLLHTPHVAFAGGSDGKESACNAGNLGSTPGEDPLEKGMATQLQYSWVESSMDRGASWATVHGVSKSRTGLSDWHFFFSPCLTYPRISLSWAFVSHSRV